MLAKTIEEVRKGLVNEGIQLGIKQGIRNEKMETARAMKKEGLSIETISRVTGLPVEEIKKLKV